MIPLHEGQVFTVAPPRAPASPLPWLIPVGLGTLAILVLVLSFDLGQSNPSTAKLPEPEGIPTPRTTGFSVVPSPSVVDSPPSPSPPLDTPTLAIAQVHCPGLVANFRIAPALNSSIQGVIQNGELIETTGRLVTQDGVVWQEIRYRNQSGWMARTFIQERRG